MKTHLDQVFADRRATAGIPIGEISMPSFIKKRRFSLRRMVLKLLTK